MFTLMPRFARPLNTSKVSGRDSLQGLYKDSLTYDNPLRFQVRAVITLPNEADVLPGTISHPQEDRDIPRRCNPSCPFGKIIIS
jgi:hypothetical protein